MDSFSAMNLFALQLKRHTTLKVVVAPTSLKEKGVHASVAMKKTLETSRRPGAKQLVRLRLTVDGTAESQTGLAQVMAGIEEMNVYLKRPRNLEDESGASIPNTRITQKLSEDDSILDNPDGTAVQDILDERTIELYLS